MNILSTTPLCYLKKGSIFPISPLQVVRFEKFQDKWRSFFKMNALSTHTPMLSWKKQFLPHISSHSQMWKILRQKQVFLRWMFWVPTPLCYLEKYSFCPISSLQVVRFEKFQDTRGSFFQVKCFEYPPYAIMKKAVFPHISSPSSQIWKFYNRDFFETNILSAHSPMLSSPSSQIWKIPDKNCIFQDSQMPQILDHPNPGPYTQGTQTLSDRQMDNSYE